MRSIIGDGTESSWCDMFAFTGAAATTLEHNDDHRYHTLLSNDELDVILNNSQEDLKSRSFRTSVWSALLRRGDSAAKARLE